MEIWWIDIGKSTDLIIYMSDDETKKPLALIALLSLFICGSVGIQIFDLKKYNLLTRVPSISVEGPNLNRNVDLNFLKKKG